MNNMNSIFTANHCSACNSINSCDGPSLGVFCEQPKDFNTSLNEDFGGEYVDAYAVTDGNMVTGRSAAASIEYAFAVLELLCGKEHTDKVKASVYYQ